MEIKLTKKQLEIVIALQEEKAFIQREAQRAFDSILKREQDILYAILDPHGVTSLEGLRFEGDKIVTPTVPDGAEMYIENIEQ
jgi:hypothetical protein